ncbi:hypothetical protein M407DRAFT_243645 [Tulasnella calospora MUT 4182]|uniref:Uncharacterized protein n=1 Tax=Tulasnella calospora MUT 4182 TaxID=1051891 RepID=A0A0C3LZ14_9AGAM|nr:hypothetical protein M407DRAFT_243645 [Tulasnella calospora MUT 4182]
MPQLLTLYISARDPHGFNKVAKTLLAAAPNLERLCLMQNQQSAYTSHGKWIRPLLCEEQDSEMVPCPQLVVLRLRGITITRWDDLRKVGSRRPAFKTLSVDSGGWEQSGGENQDLNALRQCFDVVVEDGPKF